jgi:hypothetical protein
MFQTDYRSRMFRTAYRTKNDPDKVFIGENNVPDRLFITAKTKSFRKDYLSEQNIPDKRFIGEECSGQTVYRSNKYCEWKVTHKTRTALFPARPAISCPEDANKRQRTCHCHSHLRNLLQP